LPGASLLWGSSGSGVEVVEKAGK
nr:hypothetical protein [Tanacetum cinerariifolium]GFD06540.1 hypothetical protein [Tanacetum cinerariifolium]